jgi:hypothetical protein
MGKVTWVFIQHPWERYKNDHGPKVVDHGTHYIRPLMSHAPS